MSELQQPGGISMEQSTHSAMVKIFQKRLIEKYQFDQFELI